MFNFGNSMESVGIEKEEKELKIAILSGKSGQLKVENLTFVATESLATLKPFLKRNPIINTCVPSYDVLLRSLYLPLTKEKDIEEAVHFQAEPLLPYPIDQALISKQILDQSLNGSSLLLFSVKKESLQHHLEDCKELQIEPEKIACPQSALSLFAMQFIAKEKAVMIFHLQLKTITAVLVKEGKVLAAFSHQEGVENLINGYFQPQNSDHYFIEKTDSFWQSSEVFLRLKRTVMRLYLALSKELKTEQVEAVAITGKGAQIKGLADLLSKEFTVPLISTKKQEWSLEKNFDQLALYALPIGLAINGLNNKKNSIDFRQEQYTYPKPFQRLVKPLTIYLTATSIFSFLFFLLMQQFLQIEENKMKQSYVELLANMGKSYAQFETIYLSKNAKSDSPKLSPLELSQQDLAERLAFLQQEIQSVPDTFPLFANIPRVSDVLAWLSTHPVLTKKEKNEKFSLENFNYTLVKRPEINKKKEKYQVKIELEFVTFVPKLARQFHDALITPNDFVDAKAEIKWNANHNHYKTSFYLKDKTSYL